MTMKIPPYATRGAQSQVKVAQVNEAVPRAFFLEISGQEIEIAVDDGREASQSLRVHSQR